MKVLKHILIIFAVINLAGCTEGCDPETISPCNVRKPDNYVAIRLAGAGMATIDWGDGMSDTFPLIAFNYDQWESFGTEYWYAHYYYGMSACTVTIVGDNITHAVCNGRMTALDLSKNTALTYFVNNTTLPTLDLSSNTALTHLECGAHMKTLDLSKNTALTYLVCHSNLPVLDISKNTALTYLRCPGNEFVTLDVSNNVMLTELHCINNRLTALDLSKNTSLIYLDCRANQLSVKALDDLFETLNTNPGYKQIYTLDNPGRRDCDTSIATDRGWTVW